MAPSAGLLQQELAGSLCQLSPVAVGFGIALDTWRHHLAVRGKNGGNGKAAKGEEDAWKLQDVTQMLFAVAMYFSSGPALIMLNKYIMSTLDFPFPIFVSNLGSVSLVCLTRLGSRIGLWPKPTSDLARSFYSITLPLCICSNMSLFIGQSAYLYISVPLVQILKTITLVLVMVLGFKAGTEEFSYQLVSAILLIVTGISISIGYVPSANNATGEALDRNTMWGIVLMLSASTVEAARSVYMHLAVQKLNFFDSIYAGSLTSCLVGVLLSGLLEGSAIVNVGASSHLLVCLCTASLLGAVVVLSNYWVAKLAGGLSMKVLVNARNIALVLFSVVVLGETCTNSQSVGYAVALAGLGMYNRARHTVGVSSSAQKPKQL